MAGLKSFRSLCWIPLVLSCTTLPMLGSKERKEMTGLEDMSLEYIKSQWGKPDSEKVEGEKRVVHYKNIRSEDRNPITDAVSVKICVARLELNQELLVSAWTYENCQAKK